MQLISDRDNGEQELVRFLKPYRRVTNPKICSQLITLPQLTLWVYINSRWVHKDGKNMKGDQTRSGSWCHLYLGSGHTPDQYAKIKRDLFASSRGLSGVYQDKANQLYAVVYKPTMQLSNAAIAALVGGTALAGIAGAKYARRSTPKSQAKKTPLTQTRDELRQNLQQVLDDGVDKNLTKSDFQGFENFDKMCRSNPTIGEIQLIRKIQNAIGLGEKGLSQNDVESMRSKSAIDIARTIDQHTDDEAVGWYLPNDLQERYNAASIMSKLLRSARGDSLEFDRNGNTMNRFYVGLKQCKDPETCQFTKAWFDLVDEFQDRPDLLAHLYNLVKVFEDKFTEEERGKINELRSKLIDDAREYLDQQIPIFEQELKSDSTPTISPEDVNKFEMYRSRLEQLQPNQKPSHSQTLFNRVKALQTLEMTQNVAMDAIRSYNKSRSLQPADSALIRFADTLDCDSTDIKQFNEKRIDAASYSILRTYIIDNRDTPVRFNDYTRPVLVEVRSTLSEQLKPEELRALNSKIWEMSSWREKVGELSPGIALE